jgi:hypothetical protein
MGDSLSSLGGFLGGFLLAGIFLPIAASFVVDGVVFFIRGRGLTRLVIATVLTILLIGLYTLVWQNAMESGGAASLDQTIGLILWFSIPAAALGVAVRMLALVLNPSSKAQDQDAIARRAERHAQRVASRSVARAQHGVRHA